MCMNKVCSGPYVHTYTWVSTHPYVPGLGKFIVDPRCAIVHTPRDVPGLLWTQPSVGHFHGPPPIPLVLLSPMHYRSPGYSANTTGCKYTLVQIQLAANTLLCKYISVQIHLSVNLSSNAAHNTTLASCRKPNDPVGAQHWLENIANNTGSQVQQGL